LQFEFSKAPLPLPAPSYLNWANNKSEANITRVRSSYVQCLTPSSKDRELAKL
jgi:hypothetical protein